MGNGGGGGLYFRPRSWPVPGICIVMARLECTGGVTGIVVIGISVKHMGVRPAVPGCVCGHIQDLSIALNQHTCYQHKLGDCHCSGVTSMYALLPINLYFTKRNITSTSAAAPPTPPASKYISNTSCGPTDRPTAAAGT